ncbi:hypothetical protein ACFVJK_46855 [Streptomyces sp. NPDC127172]|uniref:hypothetical protein n=1 Tax=Streptomyces sp. NPDC127172 TaxID=3345382 RepID=UPI003638DC8A
MNDLLYSAGFVLGVAALSAGPLIAHTPHPTHRHRPSWAHSPTQARRIARHARQKDIRP